MRPIDQAIAAHRGGRLAEAEALYRKVLATDKRDFDALHMLGIVYAQQSRFEEAERMLQAALKVDARVPPCLHNYGNVLAKLNRFEEAIAHYNKALAIAPGHAPAYVDRGNAEQKLGRLQAAIDSHSKAVELAPGLAPAHYNRATTLFKLKRFPESLASYDRAITLGYRDPGAYVGQGEALIELRRHADALTAFDTALAMKSDVPQAWIGRGNALVGLQRFEEALAPFDKALSYDPASTAAWLGRGTAATQANRYDEGIAAFEKALSLDASFAEAWVGLGNARNETGRYAEAIEAHDKAISLNPDMEEAQVGRAMDSLALGRHEEALRQLRAILGRKPDAHKARYRLGLTCLSLGQLAEGTAIYEGRWHEPAGPFAPHHFARPQWDGTPVRGTLLVWGEQGVGDQIIYASMIPELMHRSDRVVVAVDPRLRSLYARSFPHAHIVPLEPTLPKTQFDAHVPVASLTRHLRRSFDDFPKLEQGYLVPDPARVQQLRERLSGGGPVIGVTWISRARKAGQFKSAELKDFAPLLQMPGCRFVDLQYGDTRAEREAVERDFGVRIEHMDDIDNMNDLDGLAALIAACDAVLTVSSTTAHLAGAVGAPTWVMVPFGFGQIWYWFLDRPKSPWYPHVEVRRQVQGQPWSEVVAAAVPEVLAALAGKSR